MLNNKILKEISLGACHIVKWKHVCLNVFKVSWTVGQIFPDFEGNFVICTRNVFGYLEPLNLKDIVLPFTQHRKKLHSLTTYHLLKFRPYLLYFVSVIFLFIFTIFKDGLSFTFYQLNAFFQLAHLKMCIFNMGVFHPSVFLWFLSDIFSTNQPPSSFIFD